MNTPALTILERASILCRQAQKNLLGAAALLWQIREQAVWEGKYSSFSEYLDQDCGMSDSQASKLLKAYQYWVVDNGFSHAKLENVDTEKLYLAAGIEGIPEENLEKARTLSRQELKAERAEKDGVECQHEEIIKICAKCHQRV